VLGLGLAKAASACKITSSMAFEPDSLGMFESGKMNTAFHGAILVHAPIYAQIVDKSNALASGADFACATCSASTADGYA
jgi:hypothetical protein